MKLHSILNTFCSGLAAVFFLSACGKAPESASGGAAESPGGAAPGGQGVRTLAVIPKGTTHEFWKTIEAGARDAGREAGVKILWKGPLKENDRAQQIAIVEQFVSEGVNGVVLAPLDDVALRRPVQAAMEKKIPVLIIDSALKGEPGKDFVGYVGTDNFQGGVLGGEELARLLEGKGKVVLLRYMEGSASTTEREAGFLSALKKHPQIELLVENRYGGATASEAQSTALNMLDVLRQADGIFCSNESLTFGMLLALKQNNLLGKKFVGFDTSAPLLEGLRQGQIHALVAQDPRKMGYLGVKTLLAHLNGEKVPENVDSGVRLVTPQNVDSPEIQAILGKQL